MSEAKQAARRELLMSLSGRQLTLVAAEAAQLEGQGWGKTRLVRWMLKHWATVCCHQLLLQGAVAIDVDSDDDMPELSSVCSEDGFEAAVAPVVIEAPPVPAACFLKYLPTDALSCVSTFLDLPSAAQMTRVSWRIRTAVIECRSIWTQYLAARYPNVTDLIERGVVPAGHAGYMARLRQEKDPAWPLREVRRVAPLLQVRAPRPTGVTFYYDVMCHDVPLLSTSLDRALDASGNLAKEGCRHTDEFKWCCLSESMIGRLRLQHEGDKECDAIERFCAHNQCLEENGTEWAAPVALTVQVSYRLHGEGVPDREPVCLMAENTALYATKCHAAFRTDVDGAYIPKDAAGMTKKRKAMPNSPPPKKMKPHHAQQYWQRWAARHSGSPLPFDPTLEVYFTTRSMCTQMDERDVHIDGDRAGVCSMEVLPGFGSGTSWQADFATRVLPTLIALYE
eukprot:TRINITY_DN12714_c0_g5_i1.p1 TRINITY_DN12714_c0_g5~~TRINITY_DN12714_c0_g5_i1.p1  ORF type:complete len:451 (+),score=179.25 TRINITY_DN12714_c0_g5_i1:67-1419(+)